MKEKIKESIKIILATFIIIFGILSYLAPNMYALVKTGDGGIEVFLEDRERNIIFNFRGIPYKLFAEDGISLWCADPHSRVARWTTASEGFYNAYNSNSSGTGENYDPRNPLHYYKHEGNYGLIYDQSHSAYYNQFLHELEAERARVGSPKCIGGPEPYRWTQDTAFVDSFHNRGSTTFTDELTGETVTASFSKPTIDNPLYSVKYKYESTYPLDEAQRNLFIFTQQKVYSTANNVPRSPDYLSEEEKEKGYFNVFEKQWALWEDDHGDYTDGKKSRGLSDFADAYQEFFNTVYTGEEEDNYKNLVNAHQVDIETNEIKEDTSKIEESVTDELDGDRDLRTFEYKDSIYEVDKNAKAYVIGPYCIDYSLNDDNGDVYKTTDGYELKFNSIENIKVFNQDKKDIETLGGSFKIAYKYDNGIPEEEEGKVHRINDEYYCEVADGEEISGFDSNKPFYIVIYRGTMKPEDFKGFYAKIDFRYLESVTGTVDKYLGHVYQYYYDEYPGAPYVDTLSGQLMVGRWTHSTLCECEEPCTDTYCECEDGGHCWSFGYYWSTFTRTYTLPTMIYELKKEEIGTPAQAQYAYHHDGMRHYKKYSIVLKYIPEEETPSFEFDKTCAQTGKALYGAKFDVKVNAVGKDRFDNNINQSATVSRTTDIEGKIKLSANYLSSIGIVLNGFTGTVTVTLTETAAPAGHTITNKTSTFTYAVTNGLISGTSDNIGRGTVTDGHDSVRIQVLKLDRDGNRLTNVDAYFEIHVKYTDSTGKLVDNRGNIIRGQTENGVLNLSDSDFANMPFGFNLNGYTGTVTLTIVEVAVNGGYTISPDSKSITLRYENGTLVDYTEYTNSRVLTEYLYDDTMRLIYEWAKSGGRNSLPSYIDVNELNSWVNEQSRRTGKGYMDVLGWLVNWFENDRSRLDQVMQRTTHMTTSSLGGCVQIALEDEAGHGYELPEIPIGPPNDLFMVVAGTVFLDGTTQKGAGIVTDGKYDVGEETLFGVEVSLYEVGGGLASLTLEDGDKCTNPQVTDFNGYYEFRGVDPFKNYYIKFKYNGMEYTATANSSATYNSSDWAITSKGGETSSGNRASYQDINATTNAFDYEEIEALYYEFGLVGLNAINAGYYPGSESIWNTVKSNHSSDPEIENKIDYIKSVTAEATAGYSASNTSGTYPHSDISGCFILNKEGPNDGKTVTRVAGAEPKDLYPGQLQIHLGLVERPEIDLSLKSDIAETNVTVNGHSTKYNYGEWLTAYHQYVYEEDYNYNTTENSNGLTFYDNDEVSFEITYEIKVTNEALIPGRPTQIVDYYDSNLEYVSVQAFKNGSAITANKLNGDGYVNPNVTNSDSGMNRVYINLSSDNISGAGDEITVRITYRVKDPTNRILLDKLWDADTNSGATAGSNKISKSWKIENYAEITAYHTDDSVLDADSRPGNFDINKFKTYQDDYKTAYADYINHLGDTAYSDRLKLALGRLTDVREDDSWYVTLTLANNGYERVLTGNVWEAINDDVKTSLDLQKEYGDRYVTYDGRTDLNLEGIRVELVELDSNGSQYTRGVTYTKADGSYEFKNYIPGDYSVRFIYGDKDRSNQILHSKVTKYQYAEETGSDDKLPINGQYYESTKANPDTNNEEYWYSEKVYDENTLNSSNIARTRYSDAYDDSYSRLSQMNSTIDGTNSTSSDYEYDGVMKVESAEVTHPIYAYTSTMNLEVEYTRKEVTGNVENTWYSYSIGGVDFGVTPRAYNDVNISKYISNVKVYTQDFNINNPDALPLIDVDLNENGNIIGEYGSVTDKLHGPFKSTTFLDGLHQIEYELDLLQGATLEVTYTIKVSNDSLYDKERNIYDTIKYLYHDGKVIAVVYYGEDTSKIVSYENGKIVYHNDISYAYADNTQYKENLTGKQTVNRQGEIRNPIIAKWEALDYTEGSRDVITSRAKTIVDWAIAPYDFQQENKIGNAVNTYWTDLGNSMSEFKSSREGYTYGDSGKPINESLAHILKASDDSPLLKELKPGENTHSLLRAGEDDKIVLTYQMNSSNLGIDSYTDDYEYSNFVELTRLENTAGKVVDIEGYDITGEIGRETSKLRDPDTITDPIKPTISTGKSRTLMFTVNTGLTVIQDVVESNLWIVLVGLVVIAVGIILIRKFVLVQKKQE